ncbi:AraC family transcriptional regulator [Paenibacillus glycanilyticus]|uniref:helix-turn-helix domain-containing protein n=1 Tax=Paenibacillus glycanilyticus TaxID=126569 RepID=UPI00203C6D7A|nr:AraC family transcriptional regulator [Paenibacillus glycanilyticus]MCM3629587.1 AraC family transcriptional regulator [Paenibacillus glycanilyticus]
MAYLHEELAQAFVKLPVEVYGVYRTELEAGVIYDGHVDRPTTKCAVLISLRGQAEFIYNETERFLLEPGKILLGGMQKRLEIHTSDQGFEYGLIHYVPVRTGTEDARPLIEVSMLHTPQSPELLQLLERLLKASSSPDAMLLLEKKALFYQLISRVLQSERTQQNKASYSLIEEATAYIHDHFDEPITLYQLAERFGLKPKYFSSLFQRYTGIGPIDYLIQYRINRAYELLMTGQFTVAAVARSVGYQDAYYFSRLFKKHKGSSPGFFGLHHKRNRPS